MSENTGGHLDKRRRRLDSQSPVRLYAERDPRSLEPWFSRHMEAMTAESLKEKGAIAAELAVRDWENEKLRASMRERTTCPRCTGSGQTGPVFINGGPDIRTHRRVESMPCDTCFGTGTVPKEKANAMDWGKQMRAARLQGAKTPEEVMFRCITLGDAADFLGITPAALSAVEHGARRPICARGECQLGGCPYHSRQYEHLISDVLCDWSRAWWLGDGDVGCRWNGGSFEEDGE